MVHIKKNIAVPTFFVIAAINHSFPKKQCLILLPYVPPPQLFIAHPQNPHSNHWPTHDVELSYSSATRIPTLAKAPHSQTSLSLSLAPPTNNTPPP